MPNKRTPPRPQGAQSNEEEWARFFELFGHARVRRGIRLLSRLPSAPRCEACGKLLSPVAMEDLCADCAKIYRLAIDQLPCTCHNLAGKHSLACATRLKQAAA